MLLAASAHAARHPSPPRQPPKGPAVRYATAKEAFLNRGAAEGVEPGMQLRLSRGRRVSATCRVESVSEHAAVCAGAGAEVGDTFRVEAPPPPAPLPARPPVLNPRELTARRQVLERAPQTLVEFRGAEGSVLGAGFTADAALTHSVWAALGDADRTFQSEQLDVALRGLDLTHGLRLFVDLSAVAWSQRPSAFRLPQQGGALLYVRETEVTRREEGPLQAGSLVGSAGRLWPVNAPGVGVIDGLQAGWRSASGLEVGVYGGEIPDPVSLAPDIDRWTLGAYFAAQHTGDGGGLVSYLRDASRVSLVGAPGLGVRFEVESQAQARMLDAMDVVADARFGLGQTTAPGLLELGRVDVVAHPSQAVTVAGGLRYVGLQPVDFLSLGETAYEHRGLHADANAQWTPGSWYQLSLLGGLYRDFDHPAVMRVEAGPELALPHLFGNGGLAVGYFLETGWLGTKDLYVQAVFVPLPKLRLLARVSFLEDTPTSASGPFLTRELTSYLSAEMPLTRIFYLRVSGAGLFQLGVNSGGSQSALRTDLAAAMQASATLGGHL